MKWPGRHGAVFRELLRRWESCDSQTSVCVGHLKGWLNLRRLGFTPALLIQPFWAGANNLHFWQGDVDAAVPKNYWAGPSGLTLDLPMARRELYYFKPSTCLYLPLRCLPSSVIWPLFLKIPVMVPPTFDLFSLRDAPNIPQLLDSTKTFCLCKRHNHLPRLQVSVHYRFLNRCLTEHCNPPWSSWVDEIKSRLIGMTRTAFQGEPQPTLFRIHWLWSTYILSTLDYHLLLSKHNL